MLWLLLLLPCCAGVVRTAQLLLLLPLLSG
jgi:hypothetical protein